MKKKLILSIASAVVIIGAISAVSLADTKSSDDLIAEGRVKGPDGIYYEKSEFPGTSPNGKPYGLENFKEGMTVEEMKLIGTDPNRQPPSGSPTVGSDTLSIRGAKVNSSTPSPSDYNISTFRVGSGAYNINGAVVADTAPYIKDGSVLLPLRYVAYALGAGDNSILWDDSTQAVAIRYDKTTKVLVTTAVESKEVKSSQGSLVIAKVGDKNLISNGEAIQLEVAPEVTGGRLMLPLRALTEVFGCGAYWDEETQTVYIASPKESANAGGDK